MCLSCESQMRVVNVCRQCKCVVNMCVCRQCVCVYVCVCQCMSVCVSRSGDSSHIVAKLSQARAALNPVSAAPAANPFGGAIERDHLTHHRRRRDHTCRKTDSNGERKISLQLDTRISKKTRSDLIEITLKLSRFFSSFGAGGGGNPFGGKFFPLDFVIAAVWTASLTCLGLGFFLLRVSGLDLSALGGGGGLEALLQNPAIAQMCVCLPCFSFPPFSSLSFHPLFLLLLPSSYFLFSSSLWT